MTFGLTFEKLLVIGVIAVIIIGPERLPGAAEAFARLVRRAGEYLRDTKSKMREEYGDEIDELDWRKLDPRQYDPRRIIRDALLEEPAMAPAAASPRPAELIEPVAPRPQAPAFFTRTDPPPYDDEAT